MTFTYFEDAGDAKMMYHVFVHYICFVFVEGAMMITSSSNENNISSLLTSAMDRFSYRYLCFLVSSEDEELAGKCNPIMSGSKHGVCVIVPKSIFVSRRRTDHSERWNIISITISSLQSSS